MFELFDIFVVFASFATIFFANILYSGKRHNRKPILNVYQQESAFFWPKVITAFCMISVKKIFTKRSKNYNDLDLPHQLSATKKAIDGVYFNAANQRGDHVVVGTARRGEGIVDAFMYLKLGETELGLMETPSLPLTTCRGTLDDSHNAPSYKIEYNAMGIRVVCLEPMKHWRIRYKGSLRSCLNNNIKSHTVDLVIDWHAKMPAFNFDTDMDTWSISKAMANETWTKDYFDTLKFIHQTHFEQYGDITLIAIIDNKEYKSEMQCVRDHTYGFQREWRLFHRYALHYFTTVDGDRFAVGIICMPIAFSRLIIGHVYSAKDKRVYPVTDCDLHLYQHGESGEAPLDYAFQFKAGKLTYFTQVDVVDSPTFYISKDSESKVVESLCKFTVNGSKGWGAAEWQYRNVDGKSN